MHQCEASVKNHQEVTSMEVMDSRKRSCRHQFHTKSGLLSGPISYRWRSVPQTAIHTDPLPLG